jgi:hypothetical protein
MAQLFTNNASSTLAAGISVGATSLTVFGGEGVKFPAPVAPDFTLVTLYQKSGTTEINHEIVKVTARTGDALTIVRAQEGTAARAFNSGDAVELRWTAGAANMVGADTTGTGNLVRANSPTLVTPALGTPSALVGTNITGTAAGLSIGGNAATATTATTATNATNATNATTSTTQAVGTNSTAIATTAFCEAGFVNNNVGVIGVGSIAYVNYVSTSVASGATVAGGSINQASNASSFGAGTWRNISTYALDTSTPSMFQRIA